MQTAYIGGVLLILVILCVTTCHIYSENIKLKSDIKTMNKDIDQVINDTKYIKENYKEKLECDDEENLEMEN